MVPFYFPHDTFLCAHGICRDTKGHGSVTRIEHVSININ